MNKRIMAVLGCVAAVSLGAPQSDASLADRLNLQVPDSLDVPGEFTFNFAITTDYSFRGISQTGNDPALQGGIDWAHDSGFYAGLWASQVNFGPGSSPIELDIYGGYGWDWKDIGFDVGFIAYLYPNDGLDDTAAVPNNEYYELYAGANYDFGFAQASAYLNYSWDYFGSSGDYFYPNAAISVPVTNWASFDATFGYNFIEEDNVPSFGTPDYFDYSISGSITIDDVVTLTVGWYDTDISTTECFGASASIDTICDGRVIFTASAAL